MPSPRRPSPDHSDRRRVLQRVGGACLGAFLVPFTARGARAGDELRLRDLYEKDLSFSALAESLAGERVAVTGFMAPPLKADSNFFVLTKRPMSTCPFCETEAEWPDDIVAVYTKRKLQVLAFNIGIVVRGELELGTVTDSDTGFVSRLRLADAVVERA